MTNEISTSRAGEDLLEAVYILSKKYFCVRSVDVASYLDITKATVSRTTKVLTAEAFIVKDEDGGLKLTESGRIIAEEVYNKHCFFREWLLGAGVEPETAEREACRLEHMISSDTFSKLKKAYGNK